MKTRVICLIPEAKVRNEAAKQKVWAAGWVVPTPTVPPRVSGGCPLQAVWLTTLKPRCLVSHLGALGEASSLGGPVRAGAQL